MCECLTQARCLLFDDAVVAVDGKCQCLFVGADQMIVVDGTEAVVCLSN